MSSTEQPSIEPPTPWRLRGPHHEIACWSAGDPAGPAVVLLMGNTMPGSFWPADFRARLVASGLHTTHFDYRDIGASTHGVFTEHPYDLLDLTDDVIALADALGRERVHLVGLSMGGFIGLLAALRHPDRVAGLTTMMSTGDYTVLLDATLHGREPRHTTPPPPREDWARAVAGIPTDQPYAELLAESFALACGSRGDTDRSYWREQLTANAPDPARTMAFDHKQAADRTSENWLNLLPSLTRVEAPTLVVQGEDDPIFPPPNGRLIADAVPGAHLLTVPGMGHMLEPAFHDRLATAIATHIQEAEDKHPGHT
ncbi:alpha/beta fold hydrolase [Streptomyces sp. NPDC088729]|uniref:alpha/beta fold hydrolase n=1 Tax=Streptomyces sp. NPDC088729 TaxID=3365876 RepID=UPI0038036BEF